MRSHSTAFPEQVVLIARPGDRQGHGRLGVDREGRLCGRRRRCTGPRVDRAGRVAVDRCRSQGLEQAARGVQVGDAVQRLHRSAVDRADPIPGLSRLRGARAAGTPAATDWSRHDRDLGPGADAGANVGADGRARPQVHTAQGCLCRRCAKNVAWHRDRRHDETEEGRHERARDERRARGVGGSSDG